MWGLLYACREKGSNSNKTQNNTCKAGDIIGKYRDRPVNSSIPEEGEACIGSSHVACDVVGRHEACQVVSIWVICVKFINHDINLHVNK